MIAEISDSFLAQAFQTAHVGPWLIGLLSVIFIILCWTVFLSFRAKKQRYAPYGSIVDEKQIRKILRTAFEQRRPFELQIKSDDQTRRPTFRCSPEYVGNSTVTLEINGVKRLSDHWINRRIQVFFRLKVEGQFTYFTFDSVIETITSPTQDTCHIAISLPTMLDNRQKRSYLRLCPPSELILGAAMWHGTSMPEANIINNLAQWPLPQLLLLPSKCNDFHILDLSAGGMRISVPRGIVKTKNLEFNSIEHIILMLDLLDPEHAKRMRCWVQCRIQSVWEEHVSRDVHIGLQFLSWARPRDFTGTDNTADLEWLRLSSSLEVEVIGNWIMRRHLELYREMPHTGMNDH